MISSRRILSIFISLLFVISASRANNTMQLRPTYQFTISEGLSHNGVTSILEDSRGEIWFGTYDGLDRYNGFDFTTFRNGYRKHILASNRVRALAEDKNGNIWIGTDKGISVYTYETGKIFDIPTNNPGEKNIIRKIVFAPDNHTVLCTTEGKGILLFSTSYTFLGQHLPYGKPDETLEILDAVTIDKNNVLLASTQGILSFNYVEKTFKKVLGREVNHANSLTKLNDNQYLGTSNKGYFVFHTVTNEIVPNPYVFDFRADKQCFYTTSEVAPNGSVWFGTTKDGIKKINSIEELLNQTGSVKTGLSEGENLVRTSSIYTSKNSGCWVSTFDKGVFRFPLDNSPFTNITPAYDKNNGLKSNRMSSVSAVGNDKVLLSSDQGGVSLFNTHTLQFESLAMDSNQKPMNFPAMVFNDSKNTKWIWKSKSSELYQIKQGSKKIVRTDLKKISSTFMSAPRGIADDEQGHIWFGSNQGLFRFHLNRQGNIKKIENITDHIFFRNNDLSYVRSVYYDKLYNYLWVGTDFSGLFRFDLSKGNKLEDVIVDNYQYSEEDKLSLSSNFVTSIVRVYNGDLWVGTERGGICKVLNSDTKPIFIAFTEENGLSNNVVKSVLPDHENNLWITTNNGLNQFNTIDNSFRVFEKEDGVPFEDFEYPSTVLPNGKLVLAGQFGFICLDPTQLPQQQHIPQFNLQSFNLLNTHIKPGDTINGRVILKKQLNETNELTLQYDENSFFFKVNPLHYSTNKSHFIKYRLLPLNTEWTTVPSNQRKVQYSGLQSGEYEFQVMVSNSLHNYSEPKTLFITIEPPYWKTVWAYMLYVLLVIAIVYAAMRFILKINTLNHKLEIEQLEKDNEKTVNEAKLRYFSNISHEIKTPLTLIAGPVDLLLERFAQNEDVVKRLQLIKRQSKKVTRLIEQVHDFQKSDANSLKMRQDQFCFNLFVQDTLTDFFELAKTQDKSLVLKGPEKNIYVLADKDKLEKIFNNLLSNAFKYTAEGDEITFEYGIEDGALKVAVVDNGRGIDEDDLPHIFERFYQSDKKHSPYIGGSGIGLAFTKRLVEMHYGTIAAASKLDIGTTLALSLPIIKDDSSEQITHTENIILKEEQAKEEDPNNALNFLTKGSKTKFYVDLKEGKKLLFFAEDNRELRDFISSQLSEYYNIRTFSDGQKCVDALDEEWPDLIISDVLMPVLNGFELCKAVKSDIKTSHIPVIMLTACSDIDDQIKGLQIGADAYIKKPFDLEHLVAGIDSLLESRKKLRERFRIDVPLKRERDKTKSKDLVFLEKMYQLLEENYDDQELDINEFAKALFLNRTHFYQKVKALTNQTPYELLKLYRLQKAAERLAEADISVNEVFIGSGFKSRAHFNKLFKEKYGATPGKYAAQTQSKVES